MLADYASIERLYETTPANLEWLGRLEAVIGLWNMVGSVKFTGAVHRLRRGTALDCQQGEAALVSLLHEARNSLRVEFGSTTNAVFVAGQEFDYFEAVRKVITTATTSLFIVDPYLSPEFVADYLPHVGAGVSLRLMTGNAKRGQVDAFTAAMRKFGQQYPRAIEVRSSKIHHDRCLIVDQRSAYLSGTSFAQGTKFAPTTLTAVVDIFDPLAGAYEVLWTQAAVEPTS